MNRCLNQPGQGNTRLFERPPVFGYDLNVESLAADFHGGTINTAWSKMKKMKTFQIQNDIGLTGIVMASSILNPVADKLVGLFAVIGDGADTLEIDKAGKLPLAHMTWQNSPGSGTPNPTNKTSSLNFGENAAMRLNSGQYISIYASGDNSAQKFGVVLTIYTIALDKK